MADIHSDPTGIQAFDVTPHMQPAQQTADEPLTGFNAPMPEPPKPPQQEPQITKPFAEIAAENLAQQQQRAYDSIIAQQQEQITALMAQNQALNGQITQMVQSGAQFAQTQPQQAQQPQQQPQYSSVYQPVSPMQQFTPPSLADDKDWTLEGLAEQIGNKNG